MLSPLITSLARRTSFFNLFLLFFFISNPVMAQRLPLMPNLSPEQVQAQAHSINDELRNLRLLIEERRTKAVRVDIPWGIEDPKASIDGRLAFTSPGERRQHFAVATSLMCGINRMANLLRSVSQSMELFEPTESKQVGNWLHIAEGAAALAGSGVTIAGQLTESKATTATGLALLGGSGVFAVLKATGLFKIEILKESLMRVEFNRQFGILIRQHLASSDSLTSTCKVLLDYSKDFLPTSTVDKLDEDKIKLLKQGAEQFYILQKAVLEIGTAAESSYDELRTKLGSDSKKIPKDLVRISEDTKETRTQFDRDRASMVFLLDRVLNALPAG